MNLRRTLAAATAGLALAGGAAFAPASAVDVLGTDVPLAGTCSASGGTCSAGTPVELSVLGGGTLSISVPKPAADKTHVSLGEATAGTLHTSPSLGEVTVTDSRSGILNNNWVVTAAASNLVLDGKATPNVLTETIPAAGIGYTPASVTELLEFTVGGTATTALPAASIATAVPVISTLSVGANTVKWNPTLTILVPTTAKAGKYVGTVTHSAL